jgi:RNA polymerase-associated protein RTF1
MDESDSDADEAPAKSRAAAADDDVNKYPVDGLFISHAEKAEIMGMREVEREIKIAERREEIERMRQNRLLRHMVVSQDSGKKRKAGDLDSEAAGGQRKTARVRAKAGIDSLRRAREERSNRMHQRELERDRRKGDRSPSYGRRSASRDSDADSDVEWATGKKGRSHSPEKKETPPAELRDIERVRVGRSRFAEVCFYPGFDEAITGCFVRINIGPDASTGQDVYRMAVIKGKVAPLSGVHGNG